MKAIESRVRTALACLCTAWQLQPVRIWYAAGIATALTLLTLGVTWSAAARARELFIAVPQQLEAVRVLSRHLTTSAQKTLIDAANHYREHLEIEHEVADLETTEHAAVAKSISDLFFFEETLGRRIQVTAGPPRKYDVGEMPDYGWLVPNWIGLCVSRGYFKKWAAWQAAKLACDKLNDVEAAHGGELDAVREKYRQSREELDACRRNVVAAIRSLPPAPEAEGQDTLSPLDAALRWFDLQSREAWATGAKLVFCLLDIPMLVTCLTMTVVAWSRLLLAGGWLGMSRISRK
jgi:hypothetical protein